MKFRIVTGALVSMFGTIAIIYGAPFVQGPLWFWRDPFEADAVQLHALVVGVSAMMVGAVTIASALWKSKSLKV